MVDTTVALNTHLVVLVATQDQHIVARRAVVIAYVTFPMAGGIKGMSGGCSRKMRKKIDTRADTRHTYHRCLRHTIYKRIPAPVRHADFLCLRHTGHCRGCG